MTWFVCLKSKRETTICCAVKGEACWHGARAHWIRTQRGLFLGMFRCLGPRQKALIKRSSLGGWKVGYQLHCRSSVGPTCLHLVNTFRPSLAQIRPRLPKAAHGLTEHVENISYYHISTLPNSQFNFTSKNNTFFFFVILSSTYALVNPFRALSSSSFSSILHYW